MQIKCALVRSLKTGEKIKFHKLHWIRFWFILDDDCVITENIFFPSEDLISMGAYHFISGGFFFLKKKYFSRIEMAWHYTEDDEV
jgi:hypothetical protein